MKVTSIRGELLDMSRYIEKNADAVALGNASMNARGDLVGKGGKVLKRAEQVSADYNRANPKAIKAVSLTKLTADALSPAEAVKNAEAAGNMQKINQAKKPRKLSDGE